MTEVLGFAAAGEGEHDLLHIEKVDNNTQWLARQLARHAEIPTRDVGYCGLKDRRAVTRQWFSVRRPDGSGTDWDAFQIDGVEILSLERHDRKLRPGSHSANRFEIVLHSQAKVDAGMLDDRLTIIKSNGVPNYFGEQRFGREAGNIALARRLFGGSRMRREQRSLALSAARSFLFNEILAQRVIDGSWDHLLQGDRANLAGSGSTFAVEAIDATLEERCRSQDIHPTASLWGDGAPQGAGQAAELELQVIASARDLADGLESARMKSASRATRLVPRELSWQSDEHRVEVWFELEPGAFATTVIREFTSAQAASAT